MVKTLTLFLSILPIALSAFAQDHVAAKPAKTEATTLEVPAITPLTADEEKGLFRAALNLMAAHSKTLEDLGDDKLGKAQQKAEKAAQETLQNANAAFRKAHNAPDYCDWNLFQDAWLMAGPNNTVVACALPPVQSGAGASK